MPDSSPYSLDLALISQAVNNAGRIAILGFNKAKTKVWDKEKGHPVTETDIAVNDHLFKTLTEARPDYGWLSEETKDDLSRHSKKRCFVVDPIDGTRAFIDKSPHFTISVAIIEDGLPIVGVLLNPLKNEFYAARKGLGATLNGKAIHVSARSKIKGCQMIGYPRKFRRLGWPDMQTSVANSMAYRIALVASGEADATVAFTPKSDWDLAAAQLIVSEAGGEMTDIFGHPIRFDKEKTKNHGVVAAGPALMPLLRAQLEPWVASYKDSDKLTQHFETLGVGSVEKENLPEPQRLHIVIGGEMVDPTKCEFKDISKIDFVGTYDNLSDAQAAWRTASQNMVDNAHMRYFLLPIHELIEPLKNGKFG